MLPENKNKNNISHSLYIPNEKIKGSDIVNVQYDTNYEVPNWGGTDFKSPYLKSSKPNTKVSNEIDSSISNQKGRNSLANIDLHTKNNKINIPKVNISPKNTNQRNSALITLHNSNEKINVPSIDYDSLKKKKKKIELNNNKNEKVELDHDLQLKVGRPFTLTQLMTYGIIPQTEIKNIDYDLSENFEHTCKLNKNGGIKMPNYKLESGKTSLTNEGNNNLILTDYSLNKEFFKNGKIYYKSNGDLDINNNNGSKDIVYDVKELKLKLGEDDIEKNIINGYSQPEECNISIPEDLKNIPNSKYYIKTRSKKNKRESISSNDKKRKLIIPPSKGEEKFDMYYNYQTRLLLKEIITDKMNGEIIEYNGYKKNNINLENFADYKI